MFLEEDFKYLRNKPNSKLQLFPVIYLTSKKWQNESEAYNQGYLKFLKGVVFEFANNFSMHGMNKIFKPNSNKYKRIVWILGFLLCFNVLAYVSYRVAFKYHTAPLETVVVNTHLPVFRVPFPEVIICNRNRFNWERFETAQHMFLKPRHRIIPQYREIFEQVINAYDGLTFGKFFVFKNLTNMPPSILQELSYINIEKVSEFLAWKCHEIFSNCKWMDDLNSCCDIFFNRNSNFGTCLAFNTIESIDGLEKQRSDPYWPWRTKGKGSLNGLSVRIHIREQFHSPRSSNKKGIAVMLVEPFQWFGNPIYINTHTTTSISIIADLNTSTNDTRIISPKKRECLFKDELNSEDHKNLPNRPYKFENCRTQCQLEYLIKYCNCTTEIFYPPGYYRPCRLPDFPCLYFHYEKFQYFDRNAEVEYIKSPVSNFMKCPCLYNCNSLRYTPFITTAYMNNQAMDSNNSFIDLDVFFQSEFLTQLSTTVVYTLTDLMASFGGLAGLCIGCSLLSLVEIAYFVMIDIPHKTLLYLKMRKHLK